MSAALLLCGGRSSRMHRPKALLPWRGAPMVTHLVETLRRQVDEVVVVGAPGLRLPRLDARVVLDEQPYLGPLAGLATGLAAIESQAAFVCATDTPHLRCELVAALLDKGPTVAVEKDGFVQPLAAVYPRSAARLAAELLDAGERRPLRLLEALEYQSVPATSVPGGDSLQSLNTPEEYLDALRDEVPDASTPVEFLGRCRVGTGARERRVSVGTLADVLGRAAPELPLLEGGALSKHFLVSIEANRFVRDTALPVGADERVIVMDASVGG